MKDESPFTVAALLDYLASEGDSEQAAVIEQWAASDPSHQAWVEHLRAAWDADTIQDWMRQTVNLDAFWEDVSAAIHPASPGITGVRPRVAPAAEQLAPSRMRRPVPAGELPRMLRRFRLLVAAAAGAAVILLLVLGLRLTDRPMSTTAQVYATPAGQTARVVLADGSSMILAPTAQARVTREVVTVTGEAYFTIAPSSKRPFAVRTANALVQVLGTRFVVRQYPGDSSSAVVVEEGKISLQSSSAAGRKNTPVILSAGMRAVVQDTSVTVATGIVVENYTGWMHGRLHFDRETVGEIVTELARAYGVEIRVADSLLTRRRLTLAASVTTDPISQVLDFIGRLTDAHVVRRKDAYVLVPGRATVPLPKSSPLLPSSEKSYGK